MEHPKMALSESFLVVAIKSQISVFDQSGKRKEIQLNSKKPTEKVDVGASGNVISLSLSNSSQYLVAANDYKQVFLFDTSNWNTVKEWTTPKKSMKFIFEKDDTAFLMADKFGDIFRFQVGNTAQNSTTEAPSLVLGHLSLVLDIQFIANEKFIVSCDRDEKVRVSHYPNAYNIQSFCLNSLGHSCMVTRLLFIAESNILVSGDANGKVCFWDYITGSMLTAHSCDSNRIAEGAVISVLLWCHQQQSLVVGYDNCPEMVVYKLNFDHSPLDVRISWSKFINAESPMWSVKLLGDDLYILASSRQHFLTVVPIGKPEATTASENGMVSTWKSCVASLSEALVNEKYDTNFYQSLTKNPMDGAASYYTRKQQRLEGVKE